jgi:hypothetical protein
VLADAHKSLKNLDLLFYNKLGFKESTKPTISFIYYFILNEGANEMLKKNYTQLDSINKALPQIILDKKIMVIYWRPILLRKILRWYE